MFVLISETLSFFATQRGRGCSFEVTKYAVREPHSVSSLLSAVYAIVPPSQSIVGKVTNEKLQHRRPRPHCSGVRSLPTNACRHACLCHGHHTTPFEFWSRRLIFASDLRAIAGRLLVMASPERTILTYRVPDCQLVRTNVRKIVCGKKGEISSELTKAWPGLLLHRRVGVKAVTQNVQEHNHTSLRCTHVEQKT